VPAAFRKNDNECVDFAVFKNNNFQPFATFGSENAILLRFSASGMPELPFLK
jgi:hypothetical protein